MNQKSDDTGFSLRSGFVSAVQKAWSEYGEGTAEAGESAAEEARTTKHRQRDQELNR